MNHLGDYDVIVIGAGHAGIEAAHAAAVLGAKTAVFTMSLDAIGNMPCNPSIGGTAKGTLVRELDALGGVMGLAADATYLQSRMLNKGKGPAVHALRVQTDRRRYNEYMKHALEQTPGLAIHQAEVVALEVENGHVKGVITQLHGEYTAKCVVLATGTNLGGKIFVGDAWYASGPDGMHAANALTDSLKAAGLPLRRFKTGTPPRVNRRSIDVTKMELQPGDETPVPFSFSTKQPPENKAVLGGAHWHLGKKMGLEDKSADGSASWAAAARSIAAVSPPASPMTAHPSITMPTIIRTAQTKSVHATARKPPKVV